jgi:ubiquinone/menaquinone biosynthesis C-methylase UbiE
MGPFPHSHKSILPHWDGKTYTKYAARFYDSMTALTGWRKKIGKHALDNITPCKLLDIGCGTGYLLSLAKAKGFDVIGTDASIGMLQKAKETYGFEDEILVNALAEELPLSDTLFDIVIASGSLVHIVNIRDAAREIRRVLKPGAILRIIDHAVPRDRSVFTPFVRIFSHLSGDILHDYEYFFHKGFNLVERKTIGRAGYLQRFDLKKY